MSVLSDKVDAPPPQPPHRLLERKGKRLARAVAVGALLAAGVGASTQPVAQLAPESHARKVKVLIISMFAPEAQPWIDKLGLTQDVPVPGLSIDYPNVHCNASDVCQLTTGMGKANAASSVSALIYSGKFDLQRTYFLVAGIAGMDPSQGTLGSAAWARFLVDSDIAWEIDAREVPASWPNGFIGINTQGPGQKPPLDYKTEVFRVNEALLQKALALSKGAVLDDNATARAYRTNYPNAPANQPPSVVQCDTAAGNTYWHGAKLGEREAAWVKLLTDGQGTYCTTQQEDNATFEALTRGSKAGLLDLQRVAVLRTASNFDRPYPGQTPYDSLVNSNSGGFVPSLNNLYLAGGPLVNEIVTRWSVWKHGVPSP
ncbi:purine-nucleoside phosphorylase [Ralstonia wenshanensis]|uniref:Purine nucleoside permease n=1 Tax=Ralstonia wenshanensis TaxID=2842456 RepID=A0AAD2AT92_9RALS|nr:purine nucleoside permease [Ralstonia wenshanensis]CAJ0687207.1 hypothetical protein LMG18091_00719 [Ralstonia wenshanensis]